MATLRWIGNAQAVSQVMYWIMGATDGFLTTGGTLSAVINGKSVVTVAIGGSAYSGQDVLTFLAALAASTIPEFTEITWTTDITNVGDTGWLIATGPAGVPFTLAIYNNTTLLAVADSGQIAATGPNFWDNAANWDTGAIPANGDTVYIDNSDVDILYNISQSAVAPALVSIGANYTGQIGLPQYNSTNSSGTYREYRPTTLTIAAAELEIGNGSGAGSSLIRINTSTAACAAIIYGTGSPTGPGAESGVPSVVLDMDSTSSSLQILDGSVGVGVVSKAANVIGSLSIGQATQQAAIGAAAYTQGTNTSTNVAIGPHVEINSTTTVSAGNVLIDTSGGASLGTTINVYGGTLEVIGAIGITNLNVYSGSCYWSSTGTITSTLVGPGGTLDFSQDLQAKAITDTVQMSAGATLNDPFSVVSSLAIQPVNCTLAQVTVSLGFNHTFTRS